MADWPVWSPVRIAVAFAFWLWLEAETGADVPFWDTMRYHHRPQAADKAGKPWIG